MSATGFGPSNLTLSTDTESIRQRVAGSIGQAVADEPQHDLVLPAQLCHCLDRDLEPLHVTEAPRVHHLESPRPRRSLCTGWKVSLVHPVVDHVDLLGRDVPSDQDVLHPGRDDSDPARCPYTIEQKPRRTRPAGRSSLKGSIPSP